MCFKIFTINKIDQEIDLRKEKSRVSIIRLGKKFISDVNALKRTREILKTVPQPSPAGLNSMDPQEVRKFLNIVVNPVLMIGDNNRNIAKLRAVKINCQYNKSLTVLLHDPMTPSKLYKFDNMTNDATENTSVNAKHMKAHLGTDSPLSFTLNYYCKDNAAVAFLTKPAMQLDIQTSDARPIYYLVGDENVQVKVGDENYKFGSTIDLHNLNNSTAKFEQGKPGNLILCKQIKKSGKLTDKATIVKAWHYYPKN